jgi:peptidoglycan/LPS O-acetylase OafA/YrhL
MSECKHVAALDGMRGLAIGLVLLYHGWTYSLEGGWTEAGLMIDRIRGIGWAGVDVFFVLSGYLITGILVGTRGKPNYWRNFLIRRGLRIFPLYYAVLVFLLVASRFISMPGVENMWVNFLYVTNIAIAVWGENHVPLDIAWSLAIEEQFYLVYPWVVRWVSTRTLAIILVGVVVAMPIFRVLLWKFGPQPTLGPYTLPRFDALAWGALICVALERDRPALVDGLSRAALPIGIAALVCLYAWTRADIRFIAIGYSLNALAATALLARILKAPRGLVGKVFETRWLVYLGKISYGVYLIHLIARVAVGKALDKVFSVPLRHGIAYCALELVGMIIVTVVAATVSFYYFERPILRLKDRYAPQRS